MTNQIAELQVVDSSQRHLVADVYWMVYKEKQQFSEVIFWANKLHASMGRRLSQNFANSCFFIPRVICKIHAGYTNPFRIIHTPDWI